MVQEWWAKLNANERLVGYGAIITLISWVVGLVTGGGSYGFVAAIIVLVVYWLKYSPTSKVTWPAPVATIVLIVSGIAAILGLLLVLPAISLLGAIGYGGIYFIAAIGSLVGTLIMAYGAWREYQVSSKTA